MQLQTASKKINDWNDFHTMRVSDVMTDDPISVRVYDNVEAAWDLMEINNFRHLPVVDKHGDIQGIVSERDLQKYELHIRRKQMKSNPETEEMAVKIGHIMTKTPETVSPEMSLNDAAVLLLENKISCLPVTNGNQLVGILTEADFVKLFVLQSELE